MHDLVDVGVDDVPEGPYATVAGLVLDLLGRVPQAPGDLVAVAGRTIEVTAVDGRAITEVRISPRHDAETPTQAPVATANIDASVASDRRSEGGPGVASGAR